MFIVRCLLVVLPVVAACGSVSSGDLVKSNDGGNGDATSFSKDGGITADAANAACSASTREGEACSTEGSFCNPTPCTDACQFCNSLSCFAGKWQQLEAFPLPSAYCADAQCGTLTCGKGEFCVRRSVGPTPVPPATNITYECEKLPPACVDCTCAIAKVCPGPTSQCTPDPATQKPAVDCFSQ
jgi:hypothetical protein